jgi:geranylgeranylglycerol-phosphate geranylgeranyltransferase
MNKVVAILKLTRIEHSFMLVIAVIAAELIVSGIPSLQIFALSLVAPFLISMASFGINDYFDVEADRANRRFDRPLVNKSLYRSEALLVVITTFLGGLVASALINVYAFVIALVFSALAFLYSYRLKDTPMLGNAYIALTMVIPFIFGDFVVSGSLNVDIVLISFIVFLSGFAREVHGMIRDYEGDLKARKSRNLVFYIGKKSAASIALIMYVEAIAISVLLFFYFAPFAGNAYYLIIIAIADIMLAYVAFGYVMKKRDNRRFLMATRNISLIAMTIALVAYLVSPVMFVGI